MIDLEDISEQASSLKPLPASATRLASLLSGEGWELDDVVDVLRMDQALTARILRAVNSSLSGARSEITDVDSAVMRMGPGSVLALAVGTAAKDQMTDALQCFDLEEGGLWRHSVAAALAIDRAHRFCSAAIPNEAFAAALLHDIGKLVLARFMRPAILLVMRRHEASGCTGMEAELKTMNMHHGQVGRMIGVHWKLPEPIVEGITYHHSPALAPSERARHLAAFVAMADAVATAVGAGDGESPGMVRFTPDVAEILDMDQEDYEGLTADVAANLDDVLARYE